MFIELTLGSPSNFLILSLSLSPFFSLDCLSSLFSSLFISLSISLSISVFFFCSAAAAAPAAAAGVVGACGQVEQANGDERKMRHSHTDEESEKMRKKTETEIQKM